jgi:hypothetical protein
MSRMVATFILQKTLQDDKGRQIFCAPAYLSSVNGVLSKVVRYLADATNLTEQHLQLLKRTIGVYLELSKNPQGREQLSHCLPPPLRDGTFSRFLVNDPDLPDLLRLTNPYGLVAELRS